MLNENKIWQLADMLRGITNSADMGKVLLAVLSLKYLNEKHDDALPDESKLSYLIKDPSNTTENLITAFQLIEDKYTELEGVYHHLEINWAKFDNKIMFEVLLSIYKESISNYLDVVFNLRNSIIKSVGRSGGEHLTNQSLNKLIVSLLNIKEETSFYDGTAGYAGVLLEVIKQHPKKNLSLHGQELNKEAWAMGKLFLLLAENNKVKFLLGDTLTNPLFTEKNRVKKFDYVATVPPFGLKVNEQQHEKMMKDAYNRFSLGDLPRTSADMAFILHALSSMSERGRAIIAITNGVLFRGGLEKNIRQNLVDTDQIEAVIALPHSLLHNTSIAINLLVLNKNKAKSKQQKIQFIKATELYIDQNRSRYLNQQHIDRIDKVLDEGIEEEGFSKVVSIGEIEENLNVARYVQDDEFAIEGEGTYQIRLNRLKESENDFVPLHTLGNIYRGLNVTSKTAEETKEGAYKFIKLSDVQEGEVLVDELTSLEMKTNFKPALYQVQEGDLIVSSRGSNIKIAVIPPHEGIILLSQNFIGFRPSRSSVNSYFLQVYFESPIGQYQLTSEMGGSTVPVLNQKTFENLRVSIPSKEIQEEAVGRYRNAKAHYKNAIKQAKQTFMEEKGEMYKNIGILSSFELKN